MSWGSFFICRFGSRYDNITAVRNRLASFLIVSTLSGVMV